MIKQICFSVMVIVCGANVASAQTFNDTHRNEVMWSMSQCIQFLQDLSMTRFQGLQERAFEPFYSDAEGSWFLPSGDLYLIVRETAISGPDCKVIAVTDGVDDFKASEFDRAMYQVFDGSEGLSIDGVAFRRVDQFWNKRDENRLVTCIGGYQYGLFTDAISSTGAAIAYLGEPIVERSPC